MITRRNNKDDQTSRAEAVRARRKQQESALRVPAAKKVVSQIRNAVEEALPTQQVRTPRRTSAYRPAKRRWDAAMVGAPRTIRSNGMSLSSLPLSWRTVSFSIVLVLSALMLHLLSSPDYYINSINLSGSKNVPGEEIYRLSGLAGLNVLWLSPEQVTKNVEVIPGIKSVIVETEWPNNVSIKVIENEPVLVWSQGGQTVWVDKDGIIFPSRGQNPNVIPIMVDDSTGALPPGTRIPVNVIQGAMQLKQLRNNLELLHYDAVNGLSYQDTRNWRGYFGVGTDMEIKLAVYETLVANLVARGVKPIAINVVNKDAPYYRK